MAHGRPGILHPAAQGSISDCSCSKSLAFKYCQIAAITPDNKQSLLHSFTLNHRQSAPTPFIEQRKELWRKRPSNN